MRRVCRFAAFALLLPGLPALAQGSGRDIVVPPTFGGTLLCAAGDTLVLAGPDTLRDFQMCTLSADRQRVPGQRQDYNPNNPNYVFRWAAGAAGTHRLSLDYVLENRTVTNARRFVVQVQSAPPIVLNALPAFFYGAAQGKDLPVTVQAAPGFYPSRVDFFLDGAFAGSAQATPFAFSLPLGGALSGPHRAFIEAINASGDVYISPVQTVTVANGNAPSAGASEAAYAPAAPSAAGGQKAKTKKSAGHAKRRQR